MFKDSDKITLAVGDAQIAFPAQIVLAALLSRLQGAPAAPRIPLPAIGADFYNGKYAGLTIRDNDPAELILLPGEFEGPWEKAKAWAAEQGGELPSRIDQLVLFKNLKSEFKEGWYWSGEQCAGDAAYAWYQTFGNGNQFNDLKDNDCRCRAVRSISIR